MQKKFEVFHLEKNRNCDWLRRKLMIPKHIPATENPLLSYISRDLIPTNLNIVFLDYWAEFIKKISSPFDFLSVKGLYFAKNQPMLAKKDYEFLTDILRQEYDMRFQRAVLLPKQANYWVLIHEALHDVFSHLPAPTMNKLASAVRRNYDTPDKLENLFLMPGLNLWNLIQDYDYEAGDEAYTFNDIKRREQLHLVDEFIASFFTRNISKIGKDRMNDNMMAPGFKKVLNEVGYRINDSPDVYN